MEWSLHRQLKERFGPDAGGRSEVTLGSFRVDAEGPDGRLIEVQSSPLGLLKPKLSQLLATHRVEVIKPVVIRRRRIRRDFRTGLILGSRLSPKRGALIDAFDELVGIAHLFPHTNLSIKVMGVDVDEVREPRRRRPGYTVVDRILREEVESVDLVDGSDLWKLLPEDLPGRFSTSQLAERLGRPVDFARRVAYCLRKCGAAEVIGKQGNRRIYGRQKALSVR